MKEEALIQRRNSLNASEQRELQGRMEKRQMKEFMTVREKSNTLLPCLFVPHEAEADEKSIGWGRNRCTEN